MVPKAEGVSNLHALTYGSRGIIRAIVERRFARGADRWRLDALAGER